MNFSLYSCLCILCQSRSLYLSKCHLGLFWKQLCVYDPGYWAKSNAEAWQTTKWINTFPVRLVSNHSFLMKLEFPEVFLSTCHEQENGNQGHHGNVLNGLFGDIRQKSWNEYLRCFVSFRWNFKLHLQECQSYQDQPEIISDITKFHIYTDKGIWCLIPWTSDRNRPQ